MCDGNDRYFASEECGASGGGVLPGPPPRRSTHARGKSTFRGESGEVWIDDLAGRSRGDDLRAFLKEHPESFVWHMDPHFHGVHGPRCALMFHGN